MTHGFTFARVRIDKEGYFKDDGTYFGPLMPGSNLYCFKTATEGGYVRAGSLAEAKVAVARRLAGQPGKGGLQATPDST